MPDYTERRQKALAYKVASRFLRVGRFVLTASEDDLDLVLGSLRARPHIQVLEQGPKALLVGGDEDAIRGLAASIRTAGVTLGVEKQ